MVPMEMLHDLPSSQYGGHAHIKNNMKIVNIGMVKKVQ